MISTPCKTVVLIGGSGSNLQALIDHNQQSLAISIEGVISHRPKAYGLVRAEKAGIPTCVVDHQLYEDRNAFEVALNASLETYSPDLILLAGFMRILSPQFVQPWEGKILNIHPSLLPKYKGLHTHAQALANQETLHGATVHFVTHELDGGPIIAQVQVPVLPEDDATTLGNRVLSAEHWLYPEVVKWFAQKRLKYQENAVILDGELIGPKGRQFVCTADDFSILSQEG